MGSASRRAAFPHRHSSKCLLVLLNNRGCNLRPSEEAFPFVKPPSDAGCTLVTQVHAADFDGQRRGEKNKWGCRNRCCEYSCQLIELDSWRLAVIVIHGRSKGIRKETSQLKEALICFPTACSTHASEPLWSRGHSIITASLKSSSSQSSRTRMLFVCHLSQTPQPDVGKEGGLEKKLLGIKATYLLWCNHVWSSERGSGDLTAWLQQHKAIFKAVV